MIRIFLYVRTGPRRALRVDSHDYYNIIIDCIQIVIEVIIIP